MGRPKKVKPDTEKQPAETPVVPVSEPAKEETPAETGTVDTVSVSAAQIADPIIEGMPEMKPGETRGIVEADPNLERPNNEPASEPTEKRGRGRPKKTDAEKLADKKEKKGVTEVVKHDPSVPDKYDASAEMYFQMAIYGVSSFISKEWEPRNDAEGKGVKTSLANFLRIHQMDDLPPGLALVGSVLIYALPRLTMPETKAKINKWRGIEEKKPENGEPAK